MKSKKELYEDALAIARENIPPSKNHLDISLEKGKMLAEEYNANVDLVLIGVLLMDIKLSEAKKLNKGPEHVKMASDFAKEFLKDYDLTEKEKNIIINSIEAHHGKVPYESIEAEVCANADCYRFIHPFGVFSYAGVLAKSDLPFEEQIKSLKFKLDEKHNILSLPKAKEELEEYYEMYSKQFNELLK
jgi:hypothetical protein